MAPRNRSSLRFILIAAAVLAVAYFVNVEVQTRLGESALASTGLEVYDLPEAMALAQQQQKLVLANLSAIWCPTCRSLDKSVFSDPAIQQALGDKYVYSRIEYESEAGQAFQDRYRTRGFPKLLVLQPNGDRVKELPVTTDTRLFLERL